MKPLPIPVHWAGERPTAEIADSVIEITVHRSVALVLPALWGADAVTERLSMSSSLLHVDASMGDDPQNCPLARSLQGQVDLADSPSEGETAAALHRWVRQVTERHSGPALILIEESRLLHPASAEMLEELVHHDLARLVLLLRTEEEISPLLAPLLQAGKMSTATPQPLTSASIKPPLRHRLEGAISTSASRRVASLTGGHSVLTELVLDAARSSDTLHFTRGTWIWRSCEAPLRQTLATELAGLLSGLEEREQDLVLLTAVAGYLPEQWAYDHFGYDTLISLRRQRILSTDSVTFPGYLDLYVVPEALIQAVRTNLQETEVLRLWHKYGQHIPPSLGGIASQTALTWWAARAGEEISSADAVHAARLCIATGWYDPVEVIVPAATVVTPMLRVLRARAQLAMGKVAEAAEELQHLAQQLGKDSTGSSEVFEAQRQGVILSRRLQIFHPETAEPAIHQLESLPQFGGAAELDRALKLTNEHSIGFWLRELVDIRHTADWDESLAAQLWIGAKLGLGRHPGLGRLVLSTMLDELMREGGHHDVEEAASAVLLLISLSHDWHTDEGAIELRAWGDKPTENPALAAVADLVTAMLSMQHDRMLTAYAHATAALTTFEHRDPYGLYGLASALSATTASYVNYELGLVAHQAHQERMVQLPASHGIPSTRLLTKGFALIGTGPPSIEIAGGLLKLAVQARAEDEWNQEQQLLLLAMLGGSQEAVKRTLSAPWRDQPGRTSMIVTLANGLAEPDDQNAVDSATVLLAAGAQFFGVAILAARWQRRAQVSPEIRRQILQKVLAIRRHTTERSELLETFDDLILDDRERAVLCGLTQGHPTAEIAQHLHLSPRTIEATISRLMHRFGCENRVELTSLGLLETHG